ncbi:hypothetical protein TraAM80_07674 [Trypanosoma rangeli]|uniref:Uncharacterized protein n=1 Tax=Trypanosoma rangeli TaxID=5698 RepID=A0A3R7NBX5_TRYRA|nr:uncharacterized protein TraAM80_07674 [Trypanosoma rangeli]RNF00319.1 hypothetical protein TraAM80_07674 [Trypanosoma rangeli]|eukprot:RNF00319.1 hypothetical protein TraAM80_07674 [Trypanosoma rangeli]
MASDTATNMPGISSTTRTRGQKVTPLLAANLTQLCFTSTTPRADNAMQLSLGHYESLNKSPTPTGGAANRGANRRLESGSLSLSSATIPEEIVVGAAEVLTRAVVQRPRNPHAFVSRRVVSSKTTALFDVFGHHLRPVSGEDPRRINATMYKRHESQSIDGPLGNSCSSVIDECAAVPVSTPDDHLRQSGDAYVLEPNFPSSAKTRGSISIISKTATTSPMLQSSIIQLRSSAPCPGNE